MIINDLHTITDICNEDITITDSGTLSIKGIVNGDITIQSGGTLILHGIANGNILVSPLSTAEIYGTATNSIVNKGHVCIYGIVDTLINQSGTTDINNGAFVNGIQY